MADPFALVFQDDLTQILQSISDAFHMRMSVFDRNMNETGPFREQPISGYCGLVQTALGKIEACVANDKKLCALAKKKKRPVLHSCHAGLKEAAFPIVIDGEAIGFFIVGQFTTSPEPPRRITGSSGNPELRSRMEEAYRELRAYTEDDLDSVIKLLEIVSEYAIEKKLVSIRRNLLTDKIHDFITADLRLNPGAEEAARAVQKSASAVNKALRQTVGMSYRRYSNQLRLETAAGMLREEPELSIAEAAEKVGFQDPLYFSRLFKREFGSSPRAYREKMPHSDTHQESEGR